MEPRHVIDFWFTEIPPASHWKKDSNFDKQVLERFGRIHRQANLGELFSWRDTPEGRLAEILVLDQFSRNMYRGTPQAFASDPLALILAQEAVRSGDAQALPPGQRAFAYMPYMHSESRLIHEEAVKLFSDDGLEGNLEFEIKHKAIIDQFGRYPHRNSILGRPSTPAEVEFLKHNPGF